MQIKIEIKNLSLEDMALGVLTSLRATARANYTAAIISIAIQQQVAGIAEKYELPPIDTRRRIMKDSYAEVLDLLPEDSPFREPLNQYCEAEVRNVRDR
jgi:hypothetical protein